MSGRKRPPTPSELTDRLRQHLDVIGLTYTLEHLEEHLAWATQEKPAAGALLDRVLGAEAAYKHERRIQRRIDQSGLEIAGLDFIRRKEDLVVTGKSGTGKSHILQAIGLRACQAQMSVRYARCVDLLDDLYAGLADATYQRRLKRWAAPDLLIVDDVGLGQVRKREDEPTAAHTLFNLMDRRHGKASTAFSSNIKLSAWGKYLGDATLAVAVLDRVAMRALRLDIDGPSYRQQVARERAKQRGTKLPDDAADHDDGAVPDRPQR
jgi:hypothetical protein